MMSFTVDKVMRRQDDGTFVVDTATAARDVKGYNGPVPLEIHIENDRIVRIITLTNSETRKYINIVNNTLVPKWIGMKVDRVAFIPFRYCLSLENVLDTLFLKVINI